MIVSFRSIVYRPIVFRAVVFRAVVFRHVALLLAFALPVLFSGCANKQTSSSAQWVESGDLTQLEQLDQRAVNQRDENGRTPLHHAVWSNHQMIVPLMAHGADINAADNRGLTPMHLALQQDLELLPYLLQYDPDLNLRSKQGVRCPNRRARTTARAVSVNDIIEDCQYWPARQVIDAYYQQRSAWLKAKAADSYASYGDYLAQFELSFYADQAREKQAQKKRERIEALRAGQPCTLVDSGYFYAKGECAETQGENLAHGQGEALNFSGEKFIGEFRAGQMVEGKMYVAEQMVWHGPVVDEKPHGLGVCRFGDSLERCEVYEGQRIDELFKQRQLMLEQFALVQQDLTALRHQLNSAPASAQVGRPGAQTLHWIDMFSNDKNKRNAAQIKTAIDLFGILVEAARDSSD